LGEVVVIDETQVFQALAPFGQRRAIQDEAVVYVVLLMITPS
jgi:hypothetical protein